ncbi:MAG: AAA family ATPase [Nanoarchaeota archaeon]|nr:AAA family ATPase [Nanoarchaeota archaeon]
MNLKEFLENSGIKLERGLFLVYGKAGVGKTTFLMEIAKLSQGKVFIIDSENGFSIERFKQISEETELSSLIVIKPKNFSEQAEMIGKILDNEKLFDVIGLDTVGKHYREVSKVDYNKSNNELARQMRILKEISRNKPIIVCNQVYQDIKENKAEPVGKNYVKKWCDNIIFLDESNGKRIIKILKPKEISKEFSLSDDGFYFM